MTHVNVDEDLDHCPEAIGHQVDASGRCYWCRRKLERASPRPRQLTHLRADAVDAAYRYYYDPDWGISKEDIYA